LTMMARIKRLRALEPHERNDLWPAAWRLLVVRLLLVFFNIGRIQRRLGGAHPVSRTLEDPAIWQRRATALRRVGVVIPGSRCLARALALRWWMRSAGLDARLKLGVRRDQGQTHSHAWVECAGKPIDDQPETVAQFRVVEWAD